MKIRLYGALLCGAAFVFAMQDKPAQAQFGGVVTMSNGDFESSRSVGKKELKGTGTAKTFRTNGRLSAATVRGLRAEKPSGHSKSIFDRWGNSRGRVTGVAVDPSDPSRNRTAGRGERSRISDDNSPLPRDRAQFRSHTTSGDGFAQGNPMVHIKRR
jgi:hypothetical protein